MIQSPRFVLVAALGLLALPCLDASAQTDAGAYTRSSEGTRWLEGRNGFAIKMLVEASNLGGSEVEIGEITFPVGAGQTGGGHRHSRVEIFYVLEGELDHVVNGQSHVLSPGMVGVVRPGDEVVHRVTSQVPVRALVIWAPGGEVDRIAPNLRERPIGGSQR
jgi:quercetin dioxygenase-like cupin family protein